MYTRGFVERYKSIQYLAGYCTESRESHFYNFFVSSHLLNDDQTT